MHHGSNAMRTMQMFTPARLAISYAHAEVFAVTSG